MGLFRLKRSHRAMAAFLAPLVLGFFFASTRPSGAQLQTDDMMQQFKQLQQGRSGQGLGEVLDQTPQQPVVIQPAVPPILRSSAPSRLEQIMSARAGTRLEQFGYDQLGIGRAVTVPQTGALQDDYVLGAGDELIVSLRGQENSEFRVQVNRGGQIVLPRLNPIAAMGRTLADFRQDLEAAVHRAYVATNAFVSISRVRQISVLVTGEVTTPGSRLVTGLSSVVDALLLSGGIKKTGSLRDIRIQRNGRQIRVDLYGVLTSGSGGANLGLADGDRIIVPPLGKTVAISGLVRRPGIFEMAAGQSSISARSLLLLAGGQEVRGRYRLAVLRILPDGQTSLIPLSNESEAIHDSEVLSVQLGADFATNQATLSGATGLAGQFPIAGATRLSDVTRAPGALGLAPYTLFGIISRQNPRNLLRELLAFTPAAVLAGKEDQILQTGDIVRPISVTESVLLARAVCTYERSQENLEEAQRNPLSLEVAKFGDQRSTSTIASDVATEPTSQECVRNDPSTRVVRTVGSAASAQVQRATVDQFGDPLSEVYVTRQARQQQAPSSGEAADATQTEEGVATYPGRPGAEFDATLPDQGAGTQNTLPTSDQQSTRRSQAYRQQPLAPLNYQEQLVRPNQYALNREVRRFDELARQLGVSEVVLVNFLIDHQVTMNGAVRGPGHYFVGPSAELGDLIQAAGGTSKWADVGSVEVTSTAIDAQGGRSITHRSTLSQQGGTLASYIVRPHDEFRFNQVYTNADIGTVTLQGEVRFAGSYQVSRGEHLSQLLARAGGLTDTAYPYGTIFLRKSAANLEKESYQRAARQVEDQLLVAMTRIGSDKISPDTFSAMQSFVTDMRNQKAIGRISVVADPSILARKPQLDPILEGGDLIYVPPRPSTVSVLGEVMQPGAHPYVKSMSVGDYIAKSGGYSVTADGSNTYIVLPDGTARKVERSWLNFGADTLPPGSAIVVPRDVTPLDLRQTIIDASQIFSQFAVSIASIAVLSRQ
jgi:protein involved in polysaccharide export with SLBB domain